MVAHFYLFLFLQCFSLLLTAQTHSATREALGKVHDSKLGELSGIISAQAHPGHFWTHNDSGDKAQVFLINTKAELVGTYSLEGIDAVDIEDIATFKKEGKTYLVLADIGDNRAVRDYISLYIFEEPSWQDQQLQYRIPRTAIQVLKMRYADKPRDAEALFIDPTDLQGYLISKRDFQVGLYSFQLFSAEKSTQVLAHKISMPYHFITAADISADGHHILIKNLTAIFYWKRSSGRSIVETLAGAAQEIPYSPEPQGEAICFGENPSIFYTISERPLGLDAYLYRYTIAINK